MKSSPSVWVVDDDASIRWVLEKALSNAGFDPKLFTNSEDVMVYIDKEKPDVILTDIQMSGSSGLELLKNLVQKIPNLPVILMTAYSDLDNAVAAYRNGAFEYLPKPFDLEEAITLVKRALEKKTSFVLDTPAKQKTNEIIGEAPAMQAVFRMIGRLTNSTANILISGESGTGKELVARAVYRNSSRADNPFIAINTAAIPENLLESELFGHEKGSFTGAQSQRKGRFEQAAGGTLFLDEIGDMPIELQTRLLRVLSDGSYFRVGGREELFADVRIIAATNQSLEDKINSGVFREDLYHRLNVIGIELPPLRLRKEDIPILAQNFLQEASEEMRVENKVFNETAIRKLCQATWSGNVRELKNLCKRLAVLTPGRVISLSDLPESYQEINYENGIEFSWREMLGIELTDRFTNGTKNVLAEIGPDFERVLIKTALKFTGGKKQEAARWLGWGRNTLTRKLKELNIKA